MSEIYIFLKNLTIYSNITNKYFVFISYKYGVKHQIFIKLNTKYKNITNIL